MRSALNNSIPALGLGRTQLDPKHLEQLKMFLKLSGCVLSRSEGRRKGVSDGAAEESAKRGWTLMNNPEALDVEDAKKALPPIHSRSTRQEYAGKKKKKTDLYSFGHNFL